MFNLEGWSIVRTYRSFLLRYWRLTPQQYRIVVEQIQSGEQFRTDQIEVALAWIDAHMGAAATAEAMGSTTNNGDTSEPAPAR